LQQAGELMEEITSHVAKAVNTAISSSWAIFVAATVALFLFFFGDLVGLDRQRVDLHFSSTRRHFSWSS
jgi:hypothetical protein